MLNCIITRLLNHPKQCNLNNKMCIRDSCKSFNTHASYSGSFFIASKPASEIVTDIDSPALVDVYKRQTKQNIKQRLISFNSAVKKYIHNITNLLIIYRIILTLSLIHIQMCIRDRCISICISRHRQLICIWVNRKYQICLF